MRYVYLVWDQAGDNDLMGIYTTREGAKAKVAALNADEDTEEGFYKIEEHPLSEEEPPLYGVAQPDGSILLQGSAVEELEAEFNALDAEEEAKNG